MTFWINIRRVADIPFLVTGIILTFYIAASAFGLVKNSSEHYSNFILGTCIMTGLLAIRGLADEKINNSVKPFFLGRFVFSTIALVLATIAMGYVRYNAVTLEQMQPFFNETQMFFGWMMTVSILMLTLIHWGLLLTSIIAISIIYFFFGYLIDNPLFMTPSFRPFL